MVNHFTPFIYLVSTICVENCSVSIVKYLLFMLLPGLDWKVFTSSCLPKKYREEVKFGGDTYKVSGIPGGNIKAPWGFECSPIVLTPTIHTFFSNIWNAAEYSTIRSHMRACISQCSIFLGTKHMFSRLISLAAPTLAVKLSSTLYLDESEIQGLHK